MSGWSRVVSIEVIDWVQVVLSRRKREESECVDAGKGCRKMERGGFISFSERQV